MRKENNIVIRLTGKFAECEILMMRVLIRMWMRKKEYEIREV